jgi:hypothetical protein
MIRVAVVSWLALGAACGIGMITPSTKPDPPPSPIDPPERPHIAVPEPEWQLAQQWSVSEGEDIHSIFVALHGDTMAVYANFVRGGRSTPGLRIYQRQDHQWSEVQRIPVSWNTGEIDSSYDVVLDGDTLLVGNVVLARHDGIWAVEQELWRADDGSRIAPGALSGDTIVARGMDQQGTAYVFARTGGVWAQQQILRGGEDDVFADTADTSVAVSGDVIVVGAHFPGAAHVFRRRGGSWSLEQRVEPPDDDGRAFGFAVATDGATAVIRSNGNNRLLWESDGLTRVFVAERGTWTQQAKLEGPRLDIGSAVMVDGEDLAYGLGHRGSSIEVYVAQRRHGAWSPARTLAMPGDELRGCCHYRRFALAGSTLAVATPHGTAGMIYVYTKRR